jgi:hypothetical protein
MAAGAHLTIGSAAAPHPAGQAAALAAGAAAFLAGSAWFRAALRLGPTRLRLAGAAFALATVVLGATVSVQAQIGVLVAGVVVMLAAERRWPAARRARVGRDEGRDRALHAA